MNWRQLAAFALVATSLCLSATLAWAQDPGTGPSPSPNRRQGDAPRQRPKYDPASVRTVTGQVSLVAASARGPVRLRLGTERNAMMIFLCPQPFLASNQFQIALGDTLEVTGSVTQVKGHDTMLAGQLKKGSQVLQLRGADGRPLWSARGQGRRNRGGAGKSSGQPGGTGPGNQAPPGDTRDPGR